MARSTYIYVVMDKADPVPLATFTVKHELIRYLKRDENRTPYNTVVFRYHDGYEDIAPFAYEETELFQ